MTDTPEKTLANATTPETPHEPATTAALKSDVTQAPDGASPVSSRQDITESRQTRREVRDAKDLLLGEVPARAEQSDEKLRAMLTGTVLFDVTDTNDKYLCSWVDKKLTVVKGTATTGDCVVKTTERNLMRVYNGSLNAQIGMISGKISVSGQTNLGIYFFNLIAPRAY